MNMKKYWTIVFVVFIAAFAANALVAMLFEKLFGGSGFKWDTTTTTAAVIALILPFFLRRGERSGRADDQEAKILELFRGRGEIANHDVQNALGVSDATATRYLDKLEEQGKIEQIGSTGTGVRYRRK